MGGTILRNAKLHLTSEDFAQADSLVVQNHRIIPLDPVLLEDGTSEEIDLNGLHVAPGLIDTLINGCAGVTFGASPNKETLEKMRRYQTQKGTLTFVPTLISGPRENMTQALNSVAAFMEKHPGVCPGLHLEGPFINSERKGFHPVGYVRSMTESDVSYLKQYKKSIAYMTIAPESVKPKFIQDLRDSHIVLSIGHSNASFYDALASFKNGVSSVTHGFNGMRLMTGRDPGILGAAVLSDNIFISLIADGRHVHPALIRMIHKLVGNRLFIVSDAQAVAGSPQLMSSFTVSGTEVFVDQVRGLIDAKGSLAGSNVCLMDSVRFLVRTCGFTIDEALEAASLTPARMLGIDHEYGKIEGGYIANLIIFDDDFRIRYVVQNGFLKTSAELL